MDAALLHRKSDTTPYLAPWRGLPTKIRALYITTAQRTGGWLAEALAADSASEVVLEEVVGSAAGLARLRDEAFDAVLVSHEPDELDALELIEGYRASGADEPIVVLGIQSEQEMSALCHEVGADGYVCVHTTTTRNLIWVAARAIQRHQLLRENYRLKQAEQVRLQYEHDGADRLLGQQRAMLADLEAMRRDGASDCDRVIGSDVQARLDLPEELVDHYRELLRTYVIMGSGNLTGEMKCLADLLITAGLTPGQVMQTHLRVLEELVDGLGARSTQHVISRADLLALEVMIRLAEGYRRRYREREYPALQLTLPGFE